MKPSKCNDCQYSKIGEDFVPCFECMLGTRNHFKKKEDAKMSKVTIEYEEVKKPIKNVTATGIYGHKLIASIFDDKLSIDTSACRVFDKETAIELVAALNELVKQL